MSKFLKAIVNIVLLVAILSAGALLIPPLLGVTTKVSDGTGNTNLSRGSVTYAASAKAADLEKGDRILLEDSNGSYVYTVSETASDTSTYTLKDEVSGDTQDQQLTGGVQKVILTLPVIGMLSLILQSREGIIILGLCVAFLIILFILSEVWRKDDEDDEDEDDDDEEAEEEDDEKEKPLSRKEKRRLKKEQKRKAQEAEDGDVDEDEAEDASADIQEEETETSRTPQMEEDIVSEDGEKEDVQDAPEVKELEEEPGENTVVDTDFLNNTQSPEETGYRTQEEEDEELERSLAEAVGELMDKEQTESGQQEEAAESETADDPEEEKTSEDVSADPEETSDEEEEVQETEETTESDPEEQDPFKPVELAIPVHTAEELLKKAEEAGDHPKVIEDKENGVTILDYSDIL